MRPLFALAILTVSTPAFADELGVSRSIENETNNLAADSAFTPNLFRAHNDATGYAVIDTTLDTRGDTRVQVDARGEVNVYGPFRLLVTVQDVFRDTARPGIGAAVQILEEAKHGVSFSGYLQYKPEGFTEPEGEVEAVLAFGKRFGDLRTTANLAYGQDPEAEERDGEIGLAAQYQLQPNLLAGALVKYRDALGSTKEAIARDLVGGATATFTFNRFAVSALAGVAMVEIRDLARQTGAIGTLAIGAAF